MLTEIIIINYQTWKETISCLESLRALTNQDFKLTIVEMCNLNNSREKLRNWADAHLYMNMTILEVDKNLGFAGANNFALKQLVGHAGNDFFWLLNNDTVVEKDALSELVNTWEITNSGKKKPAFISSKIIDFTDRSKIQSLGGKINPWTGSTKLNAFGQPVTNYPDTGYLEVDYVMGASMFFHKNIINSVGLMDPSYFLYFEDIDWCHKARLAGLFNYTCLSSIVYHQQGATIGNKYEKTAANQAAMSYLYESYFLFFRKHYPAFLPIASAMLLKKFAGGVLKGHLSEAGIIGTALIKSYYRLIRHKTGAL